MDRSDQFYLDTVYERLKVNDKWQNSKRKPWQNVLLQFLKSLFIERERKNRDMVFIFNFISFQSFISC